MNFLNEFIRKRRRFIRICFLSDSREHSRIETCSVEPIILKDGELGE